MSNVNVYSLESYVGKFYEIIFGTLFIMKFTFSSSRK